MGHSLNALPIFPLSGALLLPQGRLPLHIFEPRYRNMVEDVLAGPEAILGIIQPVDPASDEDGLELFDVGCTGSIEKWERLPDGRFVILLEGRERFRVRHELEVRRGYRRVEADASGFQPDRDEEVEKDRLMIGLEAFCQRQGVRFEAEQLKSLSGLRLLNSMAMSLPFAPDEKQALLEAPSASDRSAMLLTLMQMGVAQSTADYPPLRN